MVHWFTAFLIVLLIGLVVHFIKRWKNGYRHLRKFPGPFPYPFIGNALELAGSRTKVYSKGFEWRAKYGRIYIFWMMHEPAVITSDLSLIKKVFSSPIHVNKAKQYEQVKRMIGKNALVASAAHQWRIDKKKFLPAFQKDGLELALQNTNIESRLLLKTLSQTQDKEVEILEVIFKCVLNILIRTMLELSHEDLARFSDKLMSMIDRFKFLASVRVFQQWCTNPIVWYICGYAKMETQLRKDLVDLVTEFDAIVKFNQSVQTPEELGGPKVIERSLAAIFFDPNEPLEWRCDQILSTLLAGMETTSISISWTLFYLATNPECMARAQEQIDMILGDSDEEDFEISHAQLSELYYLEMCWKEAMRLQPPGSAVGRNLGKDVKLDDGRVIPAGTDLVLDVVSVHTDPDTYPDPYVYKPERFTEEMKPYTYIPFSLGPRSCIGQKFGSTEARTMLAHILRKYTISTTQKEGDFKMLLEVATIPTPAIQLRLHPRKTINNNE